MPTLSPDEEIPDPTLDAREQALLVELQKEFERFTKPGWVGEPAKKIGGALVRIIPQGVRKSATAASTSMAETELIKKVMDFAGKGFHQLTSLASRGTLSKPKVVAKLSKHGCEVSTFDEICTCRSYRVEAVLERSTLKKVTAAAAEGAVTGAPGLPGVPFNIALSFFLYFRAAQEVALHYGYDVKDDPRELQFAAEVTLQSLDPNFKGEGLAGFIGKMMLATELTALKSALGKTYAEMAAKGGSALLYVQIRALANKAAEKALAKAGKEGLEAGIFKTLLAQIAKRLPKDAGKRVVPGIGAIFGGLSDAYLMSRVLRGAKLIYHKRFLFEKEERIARLGGD